MKVPEGPSYAISLASEVSKVVVRRVEVFLAIVQIVVESVVLLGWLLGMIWLEIFLRNTASYFWQSGMVLENSVSTIGLDFLQD